MADRCLSFTGKSACVDGQVVRVCEQSPLGAR